MRHEMRVQGPQETRQPRKSSRIADYRLAKCPKAEKSCFSMGIPGCVGGVLVQWDSWKAVAIGWTSECEDKGGHTEPTVEQ